ncbi:MAG: hypothetical protein KAU60_00185, partial [Desulfobacterales bacterium]|nr:hypothetical protein [Desulfobacterales bacterium]
ADRLLWAKATRLPCIKRGHMHLFIMSIRTNGNANSCKIPARHLSAMPSRQAGRHCGQAAAIVTAIFPP